MRAYSTHLRRTTLTPQSQPIPGREAEMVPNNAGGMGFVLDDWERLTRFLILGSDVGTYYVGEQKLTAENAACVIRCIKADGPRTVAFIRSVNVGNRAPKTDPQLFALALAVKHGDEGTKKAAAEAAQWMLRTGTHFLHFCDFLDGLGGWNRTKCRIVRHWFEGRDADTLAYQVTKYPSRDGWSMRDALRVSHPNAPTPAHKALFGYLCKGAEEPKKLPKLVKSVIKMAQMKGDATKKALFGIEHGLPREALPTEALNDLQVWLALLPQTPVHALLRNLGNITEKGLLADPANVKLVSERLMDKAALRKARVHPFAIMLASAVYQTGAGVRGSKTWVPVRGIIEALDDAYELAFDHVEATGKRMLIAIDGSGSMSAPCMGTPLPCEQAAAMLALTLARCEPNATVVVFDEEVRRVLPITRRSALSSISYKRNPTGTDLSAPVRWAMGEQRAASRGARLAGWATWGGVAVPVLQQNRQEPLAAERREFDAFILLSDNETWAGRGHTTEWLARYRREVVPKAKLVVGALAANHASVVDPQDPLQFGCVGLDANLPSLVADFISR